MITSYTSYDEIRAVLGVSDDELSNETLALGVYYSALKIAMSEVNDDFAAFLSNLKEKTLLSSRESLFVDYGVLFCTYAIASHLGASLPMFGLKDMSDSKASASRFATDPYKATIANINARLDNYRNRVLELYNELNPADVGRTPSVSFTVISKSIPATDPVTGT